MYCSCWTVSECDPVFFALLSRIGHDPFNDLFHL